MAELVYPDLSYKIVGVLFRVHNKLGNRYQEKYYHRAVAIGFKEAELHFQEEVLVDLTFSDNKIGKYFLDFVVENRIVVEIKAVPRLTPRDFRQVRAYLKAKELRLGILANFRTERLEHKRILNANACK